MIEKKVYERIQRMLKNKRISGNELAKIIGISSTSVYNYLSGEVRAPLSFVSMILESFPDVSAEWLLRGEGEMLLQPKKSTYLEMAEKLHAPLMASEPSSLTAQVEQLAKNQQEMQSQLDRLLQKLTI